jgi:hypothetical protein
MTKEQKIIRESIQDSSILIKRKDGSILPKLIRYTKKVGYDVSLQEGDRFNYGDGEYEVVNVYETLVDVNKIGTEGFKSLYRDGSNIADVLKGCE